MTEKKRINVEIGRNIQSARKRAGFTQEKFAELIGTGPKNLSAIERGISGVSVGMVQKICDTLHVSSDTIFFGAVESREEAQVLSDRLSRLSPAQFAIASNILNQLLNAFAMSEESSN